MANIVGAYMLIGVMCFFVGIMIFAARDEITHGRRPLHMYLFHIIKIMQHKIIDESPSAITDSLFLGDVNDATNDDTLKSRGIGMVISIMSAREIQKLKYKNVLSRKRGVTFIYIEANDSPEVSMYENILNTYLLVRAWGFATEFNRMNPPNILIHCKAGVSRSATLVIGYLMLNHGMSYDTALKYVQKRRRIVQPNVGFESQLRELQSLQYQLNNSIFDLYGILILPDIYNVCNKHKDARAIFDEHVDNVAHAISAA